MFAKSQPDQKITIQQFKQLVKSENYVKISKQLYMQPKGNRFLKVQDSVIQGYVIVSIGLTRND